MIVDDEGHFSSSEEEDREFTTDLQSGDTVMWLISPYKANAITHLDDISVSGSKGCFKSPPTKNPDGTWSAEVGKIKDKTTVQYTISYSVGFAQDPKLSFKKR